MQKINFERKRENMAKRKQATRKGRERRREPGESQAVIL